MGAPFSNGTPIQPSNVINEVWNEGPRIGDPVVQHFSSIQTRNEKVYGLWRELMEGKFPQLKQ